MGFEVSNHSVKLEASGFSVSHVAFLREKKDMPTAAK